MQKVVLAFTRDFSLCLLDFWNILLEDVMAETFGKGMETQIVYFTGRAMEFYRVIDDFNEMRDTVLAKGADHELLSQESCEEFYRITHDIRGLLQRLEHVSLLEKTQDVPRSFELCKLFYPYLVVSYYLPAQWCELFLQQYPNAQPVVQRWLEARKETEGVFELLDGFWQGVIGELLKQQGVDPFLRRHVRHQEFIEMMHGGPVPSQETLLKRTKGYILYKGSLLFGQDLSDFFQKHDYSYEGAIADANVQELQGTVAHRDGIIQGVAQLILNPDEVQRFQTGHILITTMTEPRFLPAMKKAAAIVTDEGGVTCHAAIVSRELGIPCIIGTKHATKVFKDGTKIEVNTLSGIVRKL